MKRRSKIFPCLHRCCAALALALPVFLFVFSADLSAEPAWTVVGPPGGDARAFASVPGQANHLYLGTTSSWLYESLDGGSSWHRLARLDGSDNLILDHIVVDAADTSTIFVAAWRDADGGLWVSHDRGHN